MLSRYLPEGAYLVALQLKVIALLALAIHFRFEAQRKRLQLIAIHGGRVHAIDENCVRSGEGSRCEQVALLGLAVDGALSGPRKI